MKVVVTGGAGYLGAVLAPRLLQAGHQVTVLDNMMHGQPSLLPLCADQAFEFVFGDVRDERLLAEVIRGADVIVPLAAVVGAPACARDPWLASSVNLDAIRLLLRLRSPAQLVIYPTTNSGYGTTTGEQACTEETPLAPITLYAQTKAQAERHVLDAGNSITLRLATVFGVSPRMRLDLLVNHFVHAAVTDGYLVVFEKDFKRSYVHIRDVADCVVHCIDQAAAMTGECYNFGLDAANLSKGELALKIREHVPHLVIHFAEAGSDPDRRNYIVSSRKLRDAGMTAARSLDDGISELIKAYRMLGRQAFKNA